MNFRMLSWTKTVVGAIGLLSSVVGIYLGIEWYRAQYSKSEAIIAKAAGDMMLRPSDLQRRADTLIELRVQLTIREYVSERYTSEWRDLQDAEDALVAGSVRLVNSSEKYYGELGACLKERSCRVRSNGEICTGFLGLYPELLLLELSAEWPRPTAVFINPDNTYLLDLRDGLSHTSEACFEPNEPLQRLRQIALERFDEVSQAILREPDERALSQLIDFARLVESRTGLDLTDQRSEIDQKLRRLRAEQLDLIYGEFCKALNGFRDHGSEDILDTRLGERMNCTIQPGGHLGCRFTLYPSSIASTPYRVFGGSQAKQTVERCITGLRMSYDGFTSVASDRGRCTLEYGARTDRLQIDISECKTNFGAKEYFKLQISRAISKDK